MTYDAWNRTVKVQSGGSTLSSYQYNGLHQLIARRDSPTPTLPDIYYYYSGSQLVEELRIDNGTLLHWYTWGSQSVNDAVVRSHCSVPEVVIHDENNNVFTQLNGLGAVALRHIYSAYGDPTALSPDWLSQYAIGEDFLLFKGIMYHKDHANYQVASRWYDPEVQRLTTRNPFSLLTNNRSWKGPWTSGRKTDNTLARHTYDYRNRQYSQYVSRSSQKAPIGRWGAYVDGLIIAAGGTLCATPQDDVKLCCCTWQAKNYEALGTLTIQETRRAHRSWTNCADFCREVATPPEPREGWVPYPGSRDGPCERVVLPPPEPEVAPAVLESMDPLVLAALLWRIVEAFTEGEIEDISVEELENALGGIQELPNPGMVETIEGVIIDELNRRFRGE